MRDKFATILSKNSLTWDQAEDRYGRSEFYLGPHHNGACFMSPAGILAGVRTRARICQYGAGPNTFSSLNSRLIDSELNFAALNSPNKPLLYFRT